MSTSLPKSAIHNYVFAIVYKKSVETCRAHHVTGIAKRHRRNELRNKYPTLSYIPERYSMGCTQSDIQTE